MQQDQNFEICNLSPIGHTIHCIIDRFINPDILENLFWQIEQRLDRVDEKEFLTKLLKDKINIIRGLPQFNESGLLIRNGDVLTFWLRYSAVRHCEYLLKLGFDVQIKATGKDYTICKAKKSFQPTQGLSRCFQ